MFDEEHRGSGEPETGSELALRVQWIGLSLIAVLGAGGNAEWSRDSLVAFGLVGPMLMMAYRRTNEGFGKPVFWRFLGWMLPCWVIAITFAIGLFHPSYRLTKQDVTSVWTLLPLPAAWVPVSGQSQSVFIEVFFLIGIYATALNARLITNGRLIYARAWAIMSLIAGAMALVGLLQWVSNAENILWLFPTNSHRFFSTFPHSAQWCAFAILWLGACLGVLAWLARQRGWLWLSGDGWVLLIIAILLGGSIWVAGEPLHRTLGGIVAGFGCIVIAWQNWRDRKSKKGAGPGIAAVFWLLIGLGIMGGIANYASHQDSSTWIRYEGDRPDLALHARVIEDTQNMWQARPWFGWGHGSYGVVFGFFQQADEAPHYWAYARSDFWQSLAENGIVGTVVWWLPILWIGLRILWKRRLASFLLAPAVGLAAIAGLSIVDFPLQSPAVFFAFWLILFSLSQWTEVDDESSKTAETDRQRLKKMRSQGLTIIHPTPPTAPLPPTTPSTATPSTL